MPQKRAIAQALHQIFAGIKTLTDAFPSKPFTIDGRLVGDIGEVIAALDYDVKLYEELRAGHDGETSQGWKVQIKATFKDKLTFRTTPDYYLGLQLFPDGSFKEIYNGPGDMILNRYKHRAGIGKQLLSFPIGELTALSSRIPATQKIALRSMPPLTVDKRL